MTEEEIHLEQLMLERLRGIIAEEDSHYLDNLMKSDEGIRLQWEKIKRVYEGKYYHYLHDLDEEDAWSRVKKGIRNRKRQKINKIGIWTIAASFLLLLFAAGITFYSHKTPEELVHVEKRDNNVNLYVNGSQTINLSQYKTSAKLSALHNVNLKVSNGSLSYAPLNNQVSQTLNTLVIPATKTYRITLSDGTEVILNSLSKLKFPFLFPGDKREVWVNGEAYFKVAKDETHPFIVHTSMTEIKVLGTEFNVNTYDSLHVNTALVEGSVVTWAADDKKVKLKLGHEAVFSSEKGFKVRTFDSNSLLSWMHGVYYFQNTPLEQITPVIRRWYADSIVFDDPKASSYRFTGALLKNKPLKEFLENLAQTSNVHYYKEDDVTHISTVSSH